MKTMRPVLVAHREVAGPEPAVGREGLRGLLGLLVVAPRHQPPAQPELAFPARGLIPPALRIHHARLDAVGGPDAGARAALEGLVEIVDQRHRVDLRHAVGLERQADAEPLHHRLEEALHAPAGGREAAGAQARAIAPRQVRVLEHRDRHRIDAVPHGHALGFHEAERHRGFERLHQDQGRAVAERGEGDTEAAPGTRQRQGVENAIVRGQAHDLAAPPAVGQAVVMTDDRAFRERRRARGVEDRERIVGAHGLRGAGKRGRPLGRVPVVDHVAQAQASRVGILRVHDHAAEERKVVRQELAGHGLGEAREDLGERLQVVHRSRVVGADERRRVRLAQDVAQLVGLVARVERHHHRADHRAPVLDEEPLGPRGQPEGDFVVLLDAQGQQAAGHALRLAQEPRVGDAPIRRDDGLALRPASGHHREHAAHGLAEKRIAGSRGQHGPHASALHRAPNVEDGSR